MKIYTKTGDRGQTSLFDGTRVKKNNPRVDTYGTIDELDSFLGIIVSFLGEEQYEKQLRKELEGIQDDLLTIGSLLANPKHTENDQIYESERFTKAVSLFEKRIDEMTQELPELTNFILPGGGKVGAQLQYARTLARRAERKIVGLLEKEFVSSAIVIYFNRLSDLLFTQSRFANFKEGKKETIWIKR